MINSPNLTHQQPYTPEEAEELNAKREELRQNELDTLDDGIGTESDAVDELQSSLENDLAKLNQSI